MNMMRNWMAGWISLIALFFTNQPGAGASLLPLTGLRIHSNVSPASVSGEFYGPFANWLDVKRDFGAQGDGTTDDTAALQAAFDAVRPTSATPVLFIPAGTYRITRNLEVKRSGHNDSKDIMILGEHPDTTLLKWEGPTGGTMLRFGAWWSRIGRLSFDGGNTARCAIQHGDLFASINEMSDLLIQDVAVGIEAGTLTNAPVAETAVLRCRFRRCSTAAISVGEWNSLDWFIWDSEFTDCRLGVVNVFGAGNFHVYRSAFERSTEADIAIGNTSYFSIRHCTSWRSKKFFTAGASGAPALITLQGNTILEPMETPVYVGNRGPLMLFDNVIRSRAMPAVTFDKADAGFVSVGNTFSTNIASTRTTNVTAFDNVVAGPSENGGIIPSLPATPPRFASPVIELSSNATRLQIQQAIDSAAANKAMRHVIHLPAGLYFIDQPLVIPTGSDLRIVGDGGKTTLKWTGSSTGSIIRITGPTQAIVRDLRLHGSGLAQCISIEGCDQENALIHLEQVDVRHHSVAGLRVRGLSRARVQAQAFYHSTSPIGVQVAGVFGDTTNAASSTVTIFGGASSDNELCYEVTDGGRLLVQDTWYETRGPQYPLFMRCTNSGTFTLHGAAVAPQHSVLDPPAVLADGFRGRLSFLATTLNFANTRLAIRNAGAEAKVLLAGTLSQIAPELAATNAVAQLACALSNESGGAAPLPDRGPRDATFLREMLQQTRGEKPRALTALAQDVSDIRLHRVFAESGEIGIDIAP